MGKLGRTKTVPCTLEKTCPGLGSRHVPLVCIQVIVDCAAKVSSPGTEEQVSIITFSIKLCCYAIHSFY